MISAIILAAGASKRMGQQKLLMKWGNVTVLERVIAVFANAGIEDILVITGSGRTQTEGVISLASKDYPVRAVFNREHETAEMLSSIQCGLRDLMDRGSSAALIGLGDQPQMEERIVRLVCDSYREARSPLVVPSYQMRRGHPWLVDRSVWSELLDMKPPQNPRDFLSAHSREIRYVNAGTSSVLADLDTPQDYRKSHP